MSERKQQFFDKKQFLKISAKVVVLLVGLMTYQQVIAASYDISLTEKAAEKNIEKVSEKTEDKKASAEKNKSPSVPSALEYVEKLMITVPEAQVIINHKAIPKMRIVLNDAAEIEYQVFQDSEHVSIRPREGSFATDTKKKVIEIQSPSVAVEVHLVNGDVQINDWLQEALIHVQKGQIVANRSKADFVLHSLGGEILVNQHIGKIEIDSFRSVVNVKELSGDLKLDSFMGDSSLESVKGVLNVSQGQGTMKILKSSGAMQFDLSKGVLNVVQFAGRVEGVSQEGPVNVNMTQETEVSIRSQSGKVTVHTPSEGGVFLNLATQEGDIYAPQYLKVNREGSQKSLRARMKGEAQKGSIFVRTNEGGIFVR